MDSVEATGATIEEAVDAALHQLGAARAGVEVEVLENPSRGLLGLVGARAARVRVTKRGDAVESAAAAALATEPVADTIAVAPVPELTTAFTERAAHLLRDIVGRVGIEAAVSIHPHDEGLLLELSGDTSGILIGRHGQMLDALEYIVNRILLRDDEHAPRVVIDSNGYRSRRRSTLEDLAYRMAEQAKRKGKPVVLNPMPPQDRRIIHLALQSDPSLTTQSSGKGVLRRLVIIPQGAAYSAIDFD